MYGSDRIEQFLAYQDLQNVRPGTRLQRAVREYIPHISSQHDHFGIGPPVANRDHGVYATHLRHLQVHQCDVRLALTVTLDCLETVRGLSHQLHVRLSFYEGGDSVAQQRVLVYGQDTDSLIRYSHTPPGLVL